MRAVRVLLVVLFGVLPLRACDPGPPEAAVELQDGTEVRVVTSELTLRQDVVLDLEVEGSGSDRLTLQITATNRSDEVVSVVQPRGPAEDGLLVVDRGYDLPWERGEIEYAAPPTVPATEVDPGSTARVGEPRTGWTATGLEDLRVCLEVVDGHLSWEDDGPERNGELMIRGSEEPVALACAEPAELPRG